MAHPDLILACIAELQADSALVAAFGESASTPKFFGSAAAGQPTFPYLVFGEPSERREYSSVGNYIAHGELSVNVFSGSKVAARTLAGQVEDVLNDADLAFPGGKLMRIRVSNSQFASMPGIGPDSPAVQCRSITFDYLLSGQL